MVQVSLVASTVLMGVILLAVAVALATYGPRRKHAVTTGGASASGTARRVAESPAAWIGVFLLLTAVATAGAILFVVEPAVSVPGGPMALLGVIIVAVLGYLVWGTYQSSRYRGLHRPAALAVAAWAVGTLVLIAVALRLMEII